MDKKSSRIQRYCTTLIQVKKNHNSLTRKLVGYRNWWQRWCKKEGNMQGFGKRKMRQKSHFFAHVNVNRTKSSTKYMIFVSFFFSQALFPSFLYHLCLQFLYLSVFFVRECFSLLVSSISTFIVDTCKYWQLLTSYRYEVASIIEDRTLMQSAPPPPPPPPPPPTVTSRRPLLFRISIVPNSNSSTSQFWVLSILECEYIAKCDISPQLGRILTHRMLDFGGIHLVV